MKIKSPLTNEKEVEPLVEAGAEELFCGIEPLKWRRKFKHFAISQRPTQANFSSASSLHSAINIAHKLKTKIHVAINAFLYLEDQYESAIEIIKEILDLGADGIILADLGLLSNTPSLLLRNKDVVIGTDAVLFNHQATKFYKHLGATRIVIPRSNTIGEIRALVSKDRSVEYEVFIIHDLCFFEDGFCAYCKENTGELKKEGSLKKKIYLFSSARLLSRGSSGGCQTRFKAQKFSARNNRKIASSRGFTFWMKKHINGCGACALYDFKKMGIASVKILDRNCTTQEKVKATSFIKESLNLLDDGKITKSNYVRKCKGLFEETFSVCCNLFDCYYPSVFLE
jgi:putative protease